MEKEETQTRTTSQKNPWRYVFAALALLGGIQLLGCIFSRIISLFLTLGFRFYESSAASIGIIGGADGPTAIFITGPAPGAWVLPAIMLTVGVIGLLRLRKPKSHREP